MSVRDAKWPDGNCPLDWGRERTARRDSKYICEPLIETGLTILNLALCKGLVGSRGTSRAFSVLPRLVAVPLFGFLTLSRRWSTAEVRQAPRCYMPIVGGGGRVVGSCRKRMRKLFEEIESHKEDCRASLSSLESGGAKGING